MDGLHKTGSIQYTMTVTSSQNILS